MQIQEVNKAALQETKATEAVEAEIARETSSNSGPVKASETQQMSNERAMKAYKSANRISSMQVSNNGDTAAFSQTGLAMAHAGSKERTVMGLDGEQKVLPKLNKLNVPVPE